MLDKTMKIKCYVSTLVFLINKEGINLIMRALFHNINYDDGCDMFMIDEWEKQQVPVKMEERNSKEIAPPAGAACGIHFSLDLENISFFAAEGE